MNRKVLIVEDEEINRDILEGYLKRDYDILTAPNGLEALRILEEQKDIAAVLLDIMMPIMNGYEVIKQIRALPELCGIPIIVQTIDVESEKKALGLGANDYVVKPFDMEILKKRLDNLIHLCDQIPVINVSDTDSLTGLFTRRKFLEKVGEMVAQQEPGHYVLSCFDIEKFKVINDLYGTKKGDELLQAIGNIFIRYFSKVDGICSRINADNFAILYPAELMDSEEVSEVRHCATVGNGLLSTITFSVGRYLVVDKALTPSAMYDRAMIAKATVKGRYDEHVAIYNEDMLRRILGEQEIVSEMKEALAEGQFEVWYQPQYNHNTKEMIGAEALVRWRHSERGLIPPYAFVPIFEQNGFIYEMDKFVWEQSCILMRELDDEGRKVVPISVNVSRYDIYQPGLCYYILSLIEKYCLEPNLLRLEITESAFAKSSRQIISVVEEFKSKGFIVEIDDFGSGYSSLNTLKDVPADVIKMDMRFLEGSENSDKGGKIIGAIVHMAEDIGMNVIAEGVETEQQAEFLMKVGCSSIQGFMYSKPIQRKDFKELMEAIDNV